jgi:hypothetical protein
MIGAMVGECRQSFIHLPGHIHVAYASILCGATESVLDSCTRRLMPCIALWLAVLHAGGRALERCKLQPQLQALGQLLNLSGTHKPKPAFEFNRTIHY